MSKTTRRWAHRPTLRGGVHFAFFATLSFFLSCFSLVESLGLLDFATLICPFAMTIK